MHLQLRANGTIVNRSASYSQPGPLMPNTGPMLLYQLATGNYSLLCNVMLSYAVLACCTKFHYTNVTVLNGA